MNRLNRYLLDTDVLVEYLRNQEQAIAYVDSLEGDLLVSAVSVAELYVGARSDLERKLLDDFVSALTVIAVDGAIARQGGLYRQQYKQSHGTGFNDALLAATAELLGVEFISFNQRHFPMLSNLVVPYKR
ncbi:type II toxin-antitoxin system VapC family toxin [Promineifilum sp.]|uniref:type II toxin-antitoxin system VapC family toxin n=1 Tax=Promineifilum sp. TaxID=2664178 RepID=UPI0035B3FA81